MARVAEPELAGDVRLEVAAELADHDLGELEHGDAAAAADVERDAVRVRSSSAITFARATSWTFT